MGREILRVIEEQLPPVGIPFRITDSAEVEHSELFE
jgi:hypothetical protein